VTASVRGAPSVRLVEGWASDRYGRRVRAPVLRLEVSGELPLRFGYRLEPASGDIVSA